ncbi:hypothetical protein GCM10010460_02820 [Microbacterium terrae]|nr:hypothetical protein GCM10017594_00420 [Microbacterium terrae]
MAEIAERAGVGRQTLYRWWPSKQAIVAACVLEDVLPVQPMVADSSGDLRADLRAWMADSAAALAGDDSSALFRGLLAAAASDAHAADALEARLSRPIRQAITAAFAAAGHPGDPAVTADILIGALLNAIVTRDPAARDRLIGVVDLVAAPPL